MELLEAIRTRRSIRSFTGAPIPRKDLETIVESARLAPSGHNEQPWEFIVVTDHDLIDELTMAAGWMDKAGAIIAVVLDPSSRWWLEDGSAAVSNILLAAHALGYGACWVEGNVLPLEERFKKLLGIPDGRRMPILVPIGVPDETPYKEKKTLAEIVHWDKYAV
jgi:nitroreductase